MHGWVRQHTQVAHVHVDSFANCEPQHESKCRANGLAVCVPKREPEC